jgi:DNA helicase-2/ATP-dependent DNA helicase PcrA
MQKKAVIGPAGTGKTRLLVERIAQILDEGSPELPELRVLVITSSQISANRIKTETENLLGNTVTESTMSIHTTTSLCEELLKDKNPDLEILSKCGAWSAIRSSISSGTMTLQSSYKRVKDKSSFIREMIELMELSRFNSFSIQNLEKLHQAADKLEDIKNICEQYDKFCTKRNLIPYFDIIPKSLDLLSEYNGQFTHIFVDQCENLYPIEIQAIKSLMNANTDFTIFIDPVLCKSDPASRIHSFGTFDSILNLDNSKGRVSVSTASHINRLLDRSVYPEAEIADKNQRLIIAMEETSIDEAEYIARTIKKERDLQGSKYSDFAILYPDEGNLSYIIHNSLSKHSIPHCGCLELSRDPVVQFIILCLQVAVEPESDDVVLKWLSSPVAGLNRADVYRVYRYAREKRRKLKHVIEKVRDSDSTDPSFEKSRDRLLELILITDSIQSKIRSDHIWKIVPDILNKAGITDPSTGYIPQAAEKVMEIIRDVEKAYENKPEPSSMLSDIEEILVQFSATDTVMEDDDSVRIMPIQDSEGLEFSFVFIPGMVDGFLPARHPARQLLYGEELGRARFLLREIDLPGTIDPVIWREQERRILYSAMTRARHNIYLTFASQYPENDDPEPSPFLNDLLGGKEITAENCSYYGIAYHEHTVSGDTNSLPHPNNIASESDLEITCYRYFRELEKLNPEKADETMRLLSGMGLGDKTMAPEPLKNSAISIKNTEKISHTAIRTFLSCPRRYFLSRLLNVKVEGQPGGAQFGRLIHQILNQFHKRFPNLSGYELGDLWQEMQNILYNAWDGKSNDDPSDQSDYESEFAHNRLQAQSYRRLAEEVLLKYLQAEYDRWDETLSCLQTERNFNLPFENGHTLIGRMDRIDVYSVGGNEIIDFKTSAYDNESESALKSKFLNTDDDPNYRPEDYQIPIYYFAGANDKDLIPQNLVIYQLRNISKRYDSPVRRVLEIFPEDDNRSEKKDSYITGGDLEYVKREILNTLDLMSSGNYPPDPRKDSVCDIECEFSFLCDREEDDHQAGG